MDKSQYKNIIGIDTYYEYFPDKPWHYFHEILEFRWYREFDYEEWREKFCIDLKMASLDRRNTVVFKLTDVYAEANLELCGWISGLDIINLRCMSAWTEVQYELVDFEDSHIHIYCNEIEIKVITVYGKDI